MASRTVRNPAFLSALKAAGFDVALGSVPVIGAERQPGRLVFPEHVSGRNADAMWSALVLKCHDSLWQSPCGDPSCCSETSSPHGLRLDAADRAVAVRADWTPEYAAWRRKRRGEAAVLNRAESVAYAAFSAARHRAESDRFMGRDDKRSVAASREAEDAWRASMVALGEKRSEAFPPSKVMVAPAPMLGKKLSDTEVAQCRWSEFALELWGDWDVLWSHAVVDYQGSAEFLAMKDGRYVLVEWSYGSCSGCDAWENQGEEETRADMRRSAMEFSDLATLRKHVEGLPSYRWEGLIAALPALLPVPVPAPAPASVTLKIETIESRLDEAFAFANE